MINHLFKIGQAKKTKLILVSILIFVGLFAISKPAYALFGVGDFGLFDVNMSALDALDFVEGIFLHILFYLILLLIVSSLFVIVAAGLLQWAISIPLGIMTNYLVQSGFGFVLGLVNLFFILILVAIALAYILKIETWGLKKALPNLIIIALLVNFSLLLVGVLIDVAQIFQNTLLEAFGGDFVSLAIEPLKASAFGIVTGWLIVLVGYLIAAFIPYVNSAALGGIAGMFLAETFLGTISQTLFLIVLNFAIGFIFFSYFVLFLFRIAMIWILAMFAPLAFLAYILPVTRKHWNEWLHLLVSWSFLGIVVLLLFGLGIKLFVVVTTAGPAIHEGGFTFPQFGFQYLFLLVYLAVAYQLSKKYTPEFADALISQAKTLVNKGVMPAASLVGQRLRRRARERVAKSERWQEWGKGQALLEKPTGRWAKPLGGVWGFRRAMGRAVLGTVEAQKRDVAGAEAEAEKIKDPDLVAAKIKAAIPGSTTQIGYLSRAIKGGKPFQKAIEGLTTEAMLSGQAANKIGAIPEVERIGRFFSDKVPLEKMGFKEYKDLDEKGKKEWDGKGYKTALDKLIGEAKGDEIKDFAKGFWESPDAAQAIQRFWGGAQLSKASQEFGYEFVQKYNQLVQKTPKEWYLKNNRSALLYTTGNAAQDLGFEPKKGLTRSEVRRELKDTKPTIPPEPPVWEEK